MASGPSPVTPRMTARRHAAKSLPLAYTGHRPPPRCPREPRRTPHARHHTCASAGILTRCRHRGSLWGVFCGKPVIGATELPEIPPGGRQMENRQAPEAGLHVLPLSPTPRDDGDRRLAQDQGLLAVAEEDAGAFLAVARRGETDREHVAGPVAVAGELEEHP